MSTQNTIARTLHDVGLASWFGGALMGAVGLNGASDQVADPSDRARVANAGWAKWTPVSAAAIAAHLLGGAQIARGNKGRLLVQRQARWVNGTKAGLTLGALAATAYARMLGQRLMDAQDSTATQPAGELPVEDATSPQASTPDEAANAQRQLTVLQWIVPAATGALVALNAKAGEQQRPGAVLQGIVRSRVPANVRLPAQALPDVPWGSVAGVVLGLGLVQRLRARRRRRRGAAVARDIMTANPAFVSEHDTLEQAARVMVDSNVGAVPVCGTDQQLKGMLTDRDIVTRVVAGGSDPTVVRAGELADGEPITIGADDPAREAVRTMARHKVRRLPVIDGQRLVGMVSQADIARAADDEVTGELVELISQPD